MCCLYPDIQTECLTVYETVADDNLANNIQAFAVQWVNKALLIWQLNNGLFVDIGDLLLQNNILSA